MANKTARFISGSGGHTVKTVNVVTTQNTAPGLPYPTITQTQTDTRNVPSFQDSQSTVAGLKTFYVPGYVSPNDTAPVLTSPSGTQTGQTTATLAVTTDHTGGTLYTVVSTSATPPSVVQIQAGHDQSGGAGAYASSATPTSGVNNFSATGLTANTTYYVYFQHHDTFGLDSTVAASSSFATLPNPATLSLPTEVALGATSMTIGATSSLASGTLYFVTTTNNTVPTATQIKTGKQASGAAATFAGSVSAASGVNTTTATGLTASTTYYTHAVQNSTGGDSNIVTSAGVATTAPAATLSLPTLVATGTTTATVGATTDTSGGTLYFVVTTVNATPTAAQIIAGHDSTGGAPTFAGNLTPSSGVNTQSVTGLTAATAYYGYAAQSSTGGSSNVVGSTVTTWTTATGTFLARTSGLDTTHKNAYAALIDGLQTDGIWSKLDVLYILATKDSTTAMLNLVSSSFTANTFGSTTFTIDRGVAGVMGSNNTGIETTFNPATASSPQFTRNSAHTAVWCVTHVTNTGSAGARIGQVTAGNTTLQFVRQAGDVSFIRTTDNGATASFSDTSGVGHYIGTRSSSTAEQAYINGSQVQSLTSSNSTAPLNVSFLVCAYHDLTTAAVSGSGGITGAASIGSGLTSTDALNYYNRMRTYMTAVGVP